MKFGKRGDSDDAGTSGGTAGDSSASSSAQPPAPAPAQPLPPVPESPPPVAEHEVPVAEQEAPGAPAGQELPVVHAEPVVEGEAYEVFADESPETMTVHQHEPAQTPSAMPFPVAEQPISVATPGPGPAPVTTLGDSAEAYASGHAAAPGGPSWQEPVMELADERPELAVAAAFAGGVLAAMILRRLGS